VALGGPYDADMSVAGTPMNIQVDPLEAVAGWPAQRPMVLLHSGRHDATWARQSILAEPVGRYVLTVGHDAEPDPGGPVASAHWVGASDSQPSVELVGRPFRDLRHLLKATSGLWIGTLSYDLGRCIEHLPTQAVDDRRWPVIELAYCPTWFVHDTATRQWTAHGKDHSRLRLISALHPTSDVVQSCDDVPTHAIPNITRVQYESAVARAIQYIAAGDVFQVNLAQRFTADLPGPFPHNARALFARLAAASPAWYGAYLEWPTDAEHHLPARAVLSTSPELFLSVNADRRVVTRPIKGTRPASGTADELRRSIKDEAELNMIVDLMRNDLGRVCEYGSVRVPDPRVIESHPTVHHGVATIEGRLHPSKDIVDLLRATLPGGSVTGAPKVRAMQIIDELEPVRRGPYCGAIGWLTRDAACLNIAIRTMLLEQVAQDRARVDFSVGSGIVADSQPDAEYQETLDKAAAMQRALGLAAAVACSASDTTRE